MRPNKPGYWWWEDKNGIMRIAEFDFYRDGELTTDADVWWFITPDRFEEHIGDEFKRWVCQAHPPNKTDDIIKKLLGELDRSEKQHPEIRMRRIDKWDH